MDITDVRIKLVEDVGDRLQAFCSITFANEFVVRDIKVIAGTNGPFVAMPSRKVMHRCAKCGNKNAVRASYCNHCGSRLEAASRDEESRHKVYADIAHPINSECREQISACILSAYEAELRRSKLPGYRCTYDDGYEGLEQKPPKMRLHTRHSTRPPHSRSKASEDST